MNPKHAHIDNYGYINARVRAMKSVLLNRDFYEELLHTQEFMGLISLMEKSPYRTEVEECAISKSEMAGVDEALKRNLSRNFRRILNFTAGEPHDLIMLLLGRWDLHNIITLLRGIHIKATSEQIMESLIPAGELDTPFLNQLSQLSTIKEVIDLLATWGSPYAKALIDKFKDYTESKNLAMMELSLYKMYYQHVLKMIKDRGYNSKILEDLISYEIDAINTTTILRLQLTNIEDMMQKKNGEVKTKKSKLINQIDENSFWHKMTQEDIYGGIIFTKKYETSLISRLWKNGWRLLGQKFKKLEIEYNYRNRKDLYGDTFKNMEMHGKTDIEKNIAEYFVKGGKEIDERKFIKMCLTLDVQKVLKDLESTSFGVILKSVLQRFLENNTISILERKIEEMIIKRGISAYNKNSLSIGIPIGYIWKKYNEVVNLRIIMRCKKVGMPERKIREELVLV